MKYLMKAEAAHASIDVCAEVGIERDRSLQQERRDGLVLEAAGADERFIDGRQIVPVLVKSGANSVEITKRRKELERARKQAFTLKQLQQPPGAGLEEALAHRWRHDRAGVDQQLRARRAGEPLFSSGSQAVAIGARGDSQQAALTIPSSPCQDSNAGYSANSCFRRSTSLS